MPTVCFRGGCLTGPNHAGAQLHGFLSYLMRCTITGEPYTVFGYGGKQVRDNIHSADLVRAFEAFHERRAPAPSTTSAAGAQSNCSMLEAIEHVRGDRRARAGLDARGRESRSATTAGGSATSPPSRPTTRSGSCATACRTSCARSTTRTSSAGRRPREALGRHPGPQRGGVGRADGARLDRAPRAGGDRLRDLVVDDASSDGTGDVVRAIAPQDEPRVRVRAHEPPRLRLRRPRGARVLRAATPWRS